MLFCWYCNSALDSRKKKDFGWPKKPKAAASQVMEDENGGVMADMIRFIIQGYSDASNHLTNIDELN